MDGWWLLLAVLGLGLLLGGGLWGAWWWRGAGRRRVRRRRSARLRHPVVLVHGVLGFDELRVGKLRQEYFRNIPEAMRRTGAEVHTVRVPATASVADRAEALARCVRALPARRVNIIAHSMGGLDARFAVARLGLADRVASVTTVGTPHLGTPIADLGTSLLGERLRKLLGGVGLGIDAFYDLTTPRMTAFNQLTPDVRSVSYASYVAAVRGGARGLNPLLLPAYLYLSERAGENDGIVPARSQPWGEVLGTVEADHWAQVGWSRRFDACAFYSELLRDLAGRGL